MTTTNNPVNVPTADASYAHGVATDAPRTRVTSRRGDETTRVTSRRGDETKAFYKTTEFIVFIVATVGVLLASYLVQATDGRGDYFLADKAWLYVVILSVGYMVSRGLAKSGSRHHNDA